MKPYGILLLALGILCFSTNAFADWIQTTDQQIGQVSSIISNNANLFAATSDAIYKSADSGGHWTRADSGLTNLGYNKLAANAACIFAGTLGNGVYGTLDNGATWTPLCSGLPENAMVLSITTNGNIVFAGIYGSGAYISLNNGAVWSPINSGLPAGATVSSIVVKETSIFAGTDSGVFISSNNGTSWNAVNSGLPVNKRISTLAVGSTYLFAATPTGVYKSQNNGTNWTAANTGLNSSVTALAVFESNLFASTFGSGVFLLSAGSTGWIDVRAALPGRVMHVAASGSYLFAGTESSGIWRRGLAEMVALRSNPLVKQVSANSKIIRTEYFSFTGQRLVAPNRKSITRSLSIKRSIHADGATCSIQP
jgi:photosystem II stability/assembly factor-like uncharacterized protein